MNILIKHPDEVRTYAFDFSGYTEIADSAETLTAPTTVSSTVINGDSDVTISDVSIAGSKVVATISGGADSGLYTITTTTNTSGGSTIVLCGQLRTIDC